MHTLPLAWALFGHMLTRVQIFDIVLNQYFIGIFMQINNWLKNIVIHFVIRLKRRMLFSLFHF